LSIERQRTVSLLELLSRLHEIGVRADEIDLGPDRPRLFMLWCRLPAFPFGDREVVWYPLLVKPGETEIDRDKVDALLRHLWHSSTPFFGDEIELELAPENPHEHEIAEKVDAKARAVRDGHEEWGGSPLNEIRSSLTFSPSESDYEYLEARIEWRQETQIQDSN